MNEEKFFNTKKLTLPFDTFDKIMRPGKDSPCLLPFSFSEDPKEGPMDIVCYVPAEAHLQVGDYLEVFSETETEGKLKPGMRSGGVYYLYQIIRKQFKVPENRMEYLVRPLMDDEYESIEYDKLTFGVDKWPETEEEGKEFCERFGIGD